MLPSQYEDFSASVVAVLLFASNVLFWRQSDYFDAAAEEKPLLHTWSLAVEEQFYIVFPLLLWFLWKTRRNSIVHVLVVLSLLSLALSQWGSRAHPAGNFYLIPSRAWELGVGAICAFLVRPDRRLENGFLAVLGLVLIAVPIVAFDESTPFPSLYTLAPVTGTALILLFGRSTTLVGRLLSTRAFVGVGLVSYSAYLWHQPLLAFARLRINSPDERIMLALGLLSLPLAWLSWRYVEQPFRRRQARLLPDRNALFSAFAVAGAAFVAFGVWGVAGKGLPARLGQNADMIATVEARISANSGLADDCEGNFALRAKCRTSDEPEFLLWGDSHAMHLAHALVASDPDIALQQYTLSMCMPIFGVSLTNSMYGLDWAQKCMDFNDKVFEWLESQKSVRYVILSAAFFGLRYDDVLRDGTLVSGPERDQMLEAELRRTIGKIQALGKSVVVVSRTPGNGANMGNCLARAAIFERDEDYCDFPVDTIAPVTRKAMEFASSVSDLVPVLRLDELICSDEICDTQQDGNFIFRDKGHLSREGSAYLGAKFHVVDWIRNETAWMTGTGEAVAH